MLRDDLVAAPSPDVAPTTEDPATLQLLLTVLRRRVEALDRLLGEAAADGGTTARRSPLRGWDVIDEISAGAADYLLLRRARSPKLGWSALTPREREAVRCACEGATNKDIAHEMNISASTVGVLLSRASRKLGATGRDELLRRAAHHVLAIDGSGNRVYGSGVNTNAPGDDDPGAVLDPSVSGSQQPSTSDFDPACDTAQQYALAVRDAATFHERIALRGGDPVDVFLAHVVATVPHYRDLARSGVSLTRLEDFPLIDRAAMLDDPAKFRSDAFDVDALDRDHYWFKTNGTLTKKFKVIFDHAAVYDALYFACALILSAIPDLVDRLWASDPADPQIHSIHDAGAHATLRNPALGGAATRYWDIGKDRGAGASVIQPLREARTTVLLGSPHVLVQLARLDEADGTPAQRIRPEVIVASGERLYPSYRRRLEAYFGCRVIDAYAATEAGFIAVDCEHGTGLHVQTDRVIVEVETESGDVVAEGSGQFVVTGMMNWAQPFVRYRLGDRGTQRWISCPCGFEGPTVSIEGREVTAYEIPGTGAVPVAVLAEILERPEVEHFQVTQDADGALRIRWTPAASAGATAAADLERALHAVLGSAVHLEAVDAIAVPGGKLLRFVTATRSSADDGSY